MPEKEPIADQGGSEARGMWHNSLGAEVTFLLPHLAHSGVVDTFLFSGWS